MLLIIVAAILSVLTVGFLIWFYTRTPKNLTKWYGVPVVLFGIAVIIALWFFAVFPVL